MGLILSNLLMLRLRGGWLILRRVKLIVRSSRQTKKLILCEHEIKFFVCFADRTKQEQRFFFQYYCKIFMKSRNIA